MPTLSTVAFTVVPTGQRPLVSGGIALGALVDQLGQPAPPRGLLARDRGLTDGALCSDRLLYQLGL